MFMIMIFKYSLNHTMFQISFKIEVKIDIKGSLKNIRGEHPNSVVSLVISSYKSTQYA